MEFLATLVLWAYVVSPALGLMTQLILTTGLIVVVTWVWLRFFYRSRHAVRRVAWFLALATVALFPLAGPRPVRQSNIALGEIISTGPLSWTPAEGPAIAGSDGLAGMLVVTPPIRRSVIAIWILGGVLVLLRFGQGVGRGRVLFTTARRLGPRDQFQLDFEMLARSLGLGNNVQLAVSDRVSVPVVVGFFEQRVVVPTGMVANSDVAARAILSHELGHVAHKELLIRSIGVLCVAIQWFNPFAWLALRELKFEGELLADDAALKTDIQRSIYIRKLLSFAGTDSCTWLSPVSAIIGQSQIMRRVQAIAETQYDRTALAWLPATLTVGSAVVIAWMGMNAVFGRGLLLNNGGAFVGDGTEEAFYSNSDP